MTKIVRKVKLARPDIVTAFWLDNDDVIRGAWEGATGPQMAEEMQAMGNGWTAEDLDAELVGTTLAALRAELEGEG